MTPEQKDKLEQACRAFVDSWPGGFAAAESSAFFAGAKTILDNPSEWGLVEKTHIDVGIRLQNDKYRGALECALQSLQDSRRHTPNLSAPINIIKSVLEQEVNNE